MVEHRGKEKGPDVLRPRKRWRNPEIRICSRAPASPDENPALWTQEKPNPISKCHKSNLIVSALSLFFPGPETTSTTPCYGFLFTLIYLQLQVGGLGTATWRGVF